MQTIEQTNSVRLNRPDHHRYGLAVINSIATQIGSWREGAPVFFEGYGNGTVTIFEAYDAEVIAEKRAKGSLCDAHVMCNYPKRYLSILIEPSNAKS